MIQASPLFLLFLVFLTLKLTGYIAWSWWIVTAPLWGPLLAVVCVLIGVAVAYGIVWAFARA